jgi:uncharacterized protein (DUF302 family)
MVRNRTHRGWNSSKSPVWVAPCPTNPEHGSRPKGARSLSNPGREHGSVPGVGRARDDNLSDFSPRFRTFNFRNQFPKQQGGANGSGHRQRHHRDCQQSLGVEKLKAILQAKGVALFALVDHSGEAEKVGLKMPPTKLVIFGSPKAGTPLMLAAPTIAIDLPLKILISEDAKGKVWVSYNSPAYLQERHHLPENLLQNIAVVETLAAKAAE